MATEEGGFTCPQQAREAMEEIEAGLGLAESLWDGEPAATSPTPEHRTDLNPEIPGSPEPPD